MDKILDEKLLCEYEFSSELDHKLLEGVFKSPNM